MAEEIEKEVMQKSKVKPGKVAFILAITAICGLIFALGYSLVINYLTSIPVVKVPNVIVSTILKYNIPSPVIIYIKVNNKSK